MQNSPMGTDRPLNVSTLISDLFAIADNLRVSLNTLRGCNNRINPVPTPDQGNKIMKDQSNGIMDNLISLKELFSSIDSDINKEANVIEKQLG